ncbi:hypothetical protein [Urechidicola croceus]|uniref:Membrane or secreted protein n=1 Tax=Urechidicola croceus TaxID=1850246 RepID=A0A1D8P8E6_9FLAO|nr:hypothetical protein [Urechidicola croceus]AOW20847.1 hypothetical protein LPB138_09240 [Urechidicola croceus]
MKTKKFLVLFTLFVVPLLFYIFLSSGIYHHANLPILTKSVQDIKGDESFKDHFSVVCFLGDNLEESKSALFNLNEVIYKRYNNNLYFQVVVILPTGLETEIETIKKRIGTYTDASKWKFVFTSKEDVVNIFNSFDTPYVLNDNYGSNYVFIVDRELRLRGRKDDEDTEGGKLYGYNMNSVADLKNKMKKDIEVIYYQLKKSMAKAERLKRDI